MLCAQWTWVQHWWSAHSLVLLVLAHPTCQTLHSGLLSGRVVVLSMCRRCVWLSGSWSCGWLLLETRVLLGGICMLLHPIHLVSSTLWCFSALWAVFWAPPSDPTHISCVVIHTWCDSFAALVAVLLWCSSMVGHGVVLWWLVCWIICLVRLRAVRWSRVHEHLIVV
jgi:hypothetical protein